MRQRDRRLLALSILGALACESSPEDHGPEGAPRQGAPAVAVATPPSRLEISVIPGIQALADSAGLSGLLQMLRTTPGTLVPGPNGTFTFDGDQRLFPAFGYFSDSAVQRLVECLDDTNPATVSRNGAPVMIGIMCSLALYRTAYSTYHETDPDWPGVVLETATPDELRAARRAWEPIVATKAYALP